MMIIYYCQIICGIFYDNICVLFQINAFFCNTEDYVCVINYQTSNYVV